MDDNAQANLWSMVNEFPPESEAIRGSNPLNEGQTFIPFEGSLYAFGGVATKCDDRATSIWRYSMQDSRWYQVPTTGSKVPIRIAHTTTAIRENMFVIGGLSYSKSESFDSLELNFCPSVSCLNLKNHIWKEVSTIPLCVSNHSSTAVGDRIYVVGGSTPDGQRTNEIRVFDSAALRWLPVQPYNSQLKPAGTISAMDIPPPVSGHSGTFWNRSGENIVVFGGRVAKNLFSRDTFMYSVNADVLRWSRLYCAGDLPQGRSHHSAQIYSNQLIVVGGYHHSDDGQKTLLDDIFILDLITLTWSRVHPPGVNVIPACGRSSLLYHALDHRVYMILAGGSTRGSSDKESLCPTGSIQLLLVGCTKPLAPQTPRRPATSRPVRSKKTTLNDEADTKRPFKISTSKSTRVFSAYPATVDPPIVAVRTPEHITNFVAAAANPVNHEKVIESLRQTYVPTKPAKRFSPLEQEEAVERLYYQQLTKAQERLNKQYFLHSDESPRKLNSTEIDALLERLNPVVHNADPPQPRSPKVTPVDIDEVTQRMYYAAVENRRRYFGKLHERVFQAHGTPVPKAQIEATVMRLTAKKQ